MVIKAVMAIRGSFSFMKLEILVKEDNKNDR